MKEKSFGPAKAVVRWMVSLIILFLFLPVSTVCPQWAAAGVSVQDDSMAAGDMFPGEMVDAASAYGAPGSGAAVKHRWNAVYSSKFTVSGLVSETDTTTGDCTLYDDGTFNCYEDEHGIDRNYTGTYAYSGATAGKIQCFLDADGLQEYSNMLTRWAEELAGKEGVVISNIALRFTSVKTPTLKISKKTGIPGNAKVTLKGTISATVNGAYITKKFSFASQITFDQAPPQQVTLSVQKSGNGSGTVTSSPMGINCGLTCSGTCNPGTLVTLTATTASGSTLSGWSGCDSAGGNTCTVTLNQSRTVTVTFQAIQAQTPAISAPSTSTGSFSVSVSYSWPPLSSNMDRYELEESTTSSSSGFRNIQTVYANVSPYVFSLTRQPGTYYYRARVLVGMLHDYSPYSSAVRVVVTAPIRSITIQNNTSTSLNLREIVQFKVALTEAGVFSKTDLLTDDSASSCRSLPGESIPSGSSETFQITAGNDYWVFIGLGLWDMNNFLCSSSSPWFKRTYFTDTSYNIHYVWRTIRVQGHTGGNMVWTISGSYLNGTLAVYPQGGSPIYFNVTPNNPIP
jgi:hypothetical protein